MVGRLFSELAELNFTMPPFAETRLLMSLEQYAGDRSVFSGASNVQPLLRMVLSEELMRADARIDLTVPPVNSFLSDELLRRCLDGGLDADIRQIIAFDASAVYFHIHQFTPYDSLVFSYGFMHSRSGFRRQSRFTVFN